jgi:Family of unknown function (DUF5764)
MSESFLKMSEFTDQLVNVFEKCIYNQIVSLFEEAKTEHNSLVSSGKITNVLELFQTKLEEIASWNRQQIDYAFKPIEMKNSKNYLDKLITTVFKSNIGFLVDSDLKVHLKIPDNNTFYHQCLLRTAEQVFPMPYIVDNRIGNSATKYDNITKFQEIIKDSIKFTIRNNIMRDNLFDQMAVVKDEDQGQGQDDESFEDIEDPKDEDDYPKEYPDFPGILKDPIPDSLRTKVSEGETEDVEGPQDPESPEDHDENTEAPQDPEEQPEPAEESVEEQPKVPKEPQEAPKKELNVNDLFDKNEPQAMKIKLTSKKPFL